MISKFKASLLIVLIAILLTSLIGCANDRPRLDSQQVISAIYVYGVPYTDHYLVQKGEQRINSTPNPVGQWGAIYEGNGTWRIQGAVVARRTTLDYLTSPFRFTVRDYYYSTTWTFIEDDNKISLIRFE